ncbi:class A beta-lactamase-related serine hydrolase [Polyangium fumosum]|uniref:Class A beta-lactamase-related serine hydrolase n=2 Tax=Polyangium fumosum TaxID=889272 RepID=A0A4U1IU39_9BACT|nr:class A beta-lactamase-related serine hydrolase [Polyangium fumosum]
MAHHHVPGVSIAVIEGGRIAWARGFGVKTAGSADPKDAVTPDTLFQVGSVSKPVTATAMLRLVERGTLELDTDVNRYLKTWKVPENEHTTKEKVTLRRLASAARAGEAAHAHVGEGKTIPGGWNVYPEMAPAGLWTTPSDLARLAIAIADAHAGRSKVLLSQATAEQMLTPRSRRPSS